jgi:hypothetical protein
MTLDGYLPFTGLKEGYYNTDKFLAWLKESFCPRSIDCGFQWTCLSTRRRKCVGLSRKLDISSVIYRHIHRIIIQSNLPSRYWRRGWSVIGYSSVNSAIPLVISWSSLYEKVGVIALRDNNFTMLVYIELFEIPAASRAVWSWPQHWIVTSTGSL